MRILAVDDDPVVLEMLQAALTREDMNCDLVCCEDAEQAMEVLDTNIKPFDCFLLDIMLPGIDGIELCGNIREKSEYKSTPVIMITGCTDPSLMGRAFGAGATDFVTKPLSGLDLGARINTASMLNDSIIREREAKVTLAEMTAKMRLSFEEVLVLEARGVTDVSAMENDLLRLPEGCYAMHLFSIEIQDLRERHERISAPAFRQHVEQAARSVTEALEGQTYKLAYTGSGRFVGILMQRRRIDPAAILTSAHAALARNWDAKRCEMDQFPSLHMTALSDQRLWSGRSAGDQLHRSLNAFMDVDAMEDMHASYAIAAE